MGTVAAAVTRAAAIGTAAAALGVVVFTAIADSQSGHHPTARPTPTHPVTPVPVSTLPGSVDSPGAGGHVTAAQRKRWLRGLVGTWTRNTKNTYFRFHSDGSGEWVAFGQELWTGTVHPLSARTFDLADPAGRGGSYWRVRLLGHDRMLFAGTRQTFRRT